MIARIFFLSYWWIQLHNSFLKANSQIARLFLNAFPLETVHVEARAYVSFFHGHSEWFFIVNSASNSTKLLQDINLWLIVHNSNSTNNKRYSILFKTKPSEDFSPECKLELLLQLLHHRSTELQLWQFSSHKVTNIHHCVQAIRQWKSRKIPGANRNLNQFLQDHELPPWQP